MKLVSFETKGIGRYGLVVDQGIIDLHARLGKTLPTLRDLLEAGEVSQAQSMGQTETSDYSIEDVQFLPPIVHPHKIICVGLNYKNPNQKTSDKAQAPKYPNIFMRVPDSLVGHGAHIVRPPESPQLDYEGEIAIVIGKPGRRIPEEHALSHIAGITCMNEGTIRDWMWHGTVNVTQGKNFDRSGAIGPWLTTADEFSTLDNIRISTRVNGEVRQDDTTANLVFTFAFLIRYISTFTTLRPGDIIATGTPSGSGAGLDPPKYLIPGDIVEVEVQGVGKLSNSVIDELAES
jgi:2-keto-4-pentenoate hydratase/2-oxohepta-3-ene-1,7-dioic acid hydratase in catechol pathway